MGAVEGRKVVVTGASGIVGSGVSRRFLQDGATVIAPLRSEASRPGLEDELQGLQLREGQLDTPLLDYSTAAGIAELVRHLQTAHGGSVDCVVASYGGSFVMGPLSALTEGDFQGALGRALPHMLLAQALMPLLKEDPASCYIFVDGMLGEVCSMPNAAALSIANAAIYGIARSLEAEWQDRPQRINELRIAAVIRKDSKPGHPFLTGMRAFPASLVGAEAVALAAGQQRGQIVRLTPADLEAKAIVVQ